jgi:phytoene dehydrogenase-like protein
MRYDAVIVGGGHNGLVAAAYLARAGRSVLLLERRPHVGGAAVSERPWPGVDARLSRYAYLVSLLPRALASDLGVAVELRRRAVASYTPRPDGGGLLVRAGEPPNAAWRDLQAMTARVAERVFPTLTQPLPTRAELRAAGRALPRRPRARRRPDRRADRHVRGPRRAVAAPEPLLPLPRDRQRHGRLGRAGGRHGRAHGRAGRGRA